MLSSIPPSWSVTDPLRLRPRPRPNGVSLSTMVANVLLLLSALCLPHTVVDAAEITKREVLTDLSDGFCRSYKFGANIVNDVLYMINLDGGIIPGDGDGDNNYLVELDLTSSFSTNDGSKYKMSLVDSAVPKLKDQALWSDQANTTLYSYGGRGASNTSADEGLWTYTIADQKWQLQQTSIKPVRLVGGGYTDAPEIQAAYWVGGYQSKDTTLGITDDTLDFATGMIQFNTTTGVFTQLEAPFTPVQQGALLYIPTVGGLGILVYLGGEVPSIQRGINATLTPNAWDYVQVYDIAAEKWYNQTTTGSVSSRTQFCAVVQHEEDSSSYEIYVIGGADFESQETLSDISFLSIPSFRWYRAGGLNKGRMTLTCESYGRQIFGVGGRFAWADDSEAGCYRMPAFIYDTVSEVSRTDFDPGLSTYTVAPTTANDIEDSPYPSSWNDPALARLFESSSNSTNSTDPAGDDQMGTGGSSKAPIIGGVVGGVGGALVIAAGLAWFIIRRRKRARAQAVDAAAVAESGGETKPKVFGGELPSAGLQELETRTERSELMGDNMPVHELGTENHR